MKELTIKHSKLLDTQRTLNALLSLDFEGNSTRTKEIKEATKERFRLAEEINKLNKDLSDPSSKHIAVLRLSKEKLCRQLMLLPPTGMTKQEWENTHEKYKINNKLSIELQLIKAKEDYKKTLALTKEKYPNRLFSDLLIEDKKIHFPLNFLLQKEEDPIGLLIEQSEEALHDRQYKEKVILAKNSKIKEMQMQAKKIIKSSKSTIKEIDEAILKIKQSLQAVSTN